MECAHTRPSGAGQLEGGHHFVTAGSAVELGLEEAYKQNCHSALLLAMNAWLKHIWFCDNKLTTQTQSVCGE